MADAHFNLGTTHYERGRRRLAREHYRVFLSLTADGKNDDE